MILVSTSMTRAAGTTGTVVYCRPSFRLRVRRFPSSSAFISHRCPSPSRTRHQSFHVVESDEFRQRLEHQFPLPCLIA